MSYEGRIQLFCQNGHYLVREAGYNLDEEEAPCHCGARLVWSNAVDDTNCEAFGEIPESVLKDKFMVSDEVVETCNLGHKHVTKERVYRIPSIAETDSLCTFRPDGGGQVLVSTRTEEVLERGFF